MAVAPSRSTIPSVTTAEDRPMRAPRTPEGWRVQAGLLARGSSPFSAFPSFGVQSPVANWRRARRRQLRGQLRSCLATGMANRTGSTRPAHLNFVMEKGRAIFVNAWTFIFLV